MEFSALMVSLKVNIQDLQANLSKASQSLESFAKRHSEAFTSLGKKLTLFGGAVTGALALTVKSAGDFESAVIRAASATGLSGKDFNEARDRITELARVMGKDSVFSAGEAANALQILTDRGFNPLNLSISQVQPMLDLATASNISLGQATESILAAMRAFGLSLDDSTKIADIFTKTSQNSAVSIAELSGSLEYIAPIAKRTGLSIEEITAVIGKVSDLGFPASMATMALRTGLAELISPSKTATDIFDKLGLTIEDLSIKNLGLTGVFEKLDKAGATSADIMEIFGNRAGPVMTALLGVDSSGRKAYESISLLTKANEAAGGSAKELADIQLQSLNKQIELLMGEIQDIAITIGNIFIPKIKEVVHTVGGVIEKFAEWVRQNPELASKIGMVVGAIGLLSTGIGAVSLAISPLLKTIGFLATHLFTAHAATTAVQGAMATHAAFITASFLPLLATLVIAIGAVASAWIVLRNEQLKAQEADMQTVRVSTKAIDDRLAKLTELETKYGNLSEADRNRIENAKAELERLRAWGEEMAKAKEVSDIEIESLHSRSLAIGETVMAIQSEIEAKELLTIEDQKRQELKALELEQTQKEIDQKILLAQADQDMLLRIQELNLAYQTGQISIVTYQQAIEALPLSFAKVYGSADEAKKKIDELQKTSPLLIEAKYTNVGVEDFEAVAERIRQTQKEMVLEQLEGDQRRVASLRFELEEHLTTITKKRAANETYHKERLALIQSELEQALAMYRANYELLSQEEQKEVDEKISRAKKVFDERIRLETERFNKMVGIYKDEETTLKDQTALMLKLIQMKGEADKKLTSIAETESEKRKRAYMDEVNAYLKAQQVIERPINVPEAPAPTKGKTTAPAKGGGGTISISGPMPIPEPGNLQDLLNKFPPDILKSGLIGFSRSLIESYSQEEQARLRNIVGERIFTAWMKQGGYSISQFRAAQAGMEVVPRAGLYKLHRGEEVVPAGRAGREGTITIINKITPDFISEMLDPNVVINIINSDIIRNGLTRRVIKGALA